jgi:ADP-ribose pyrophosphatase YjhB (NUDIX family)
MPTDRDITQKSRDRSKPRLKSTTSHRDDLVKGVDYIGVGVGAMVFDSASRVFLAQRGPAARNERNHWEFPGGAVQLRERLEDAIKREFLEEFGMVIAPESLLCVTDHILLAENQHWVAACFIARHVAGEPSVREADKCLAFRWSSLSDLPFPLTLISTSFLRAYQAVPGLDGNVSVARSLSPAVVESVPPAGRRRPKRIRELEPGK